MLISKLLKRIPKVKRFISLHNPSGKYLIEKTGILNHQKPVVIDVGSNTGQTIDLILSINPNVEIFAFEPTAELISKLKERYKTYNNIQIFEIALSDVNGDADFYTSVFSATNSLLRPNVKLYREFGHPISDILENSGIVKCKVETFDSWYIKNANNTVIDLMKIDTQGTEYEVLKGSLSTLRTKIKAVILELQYLTFYTSSKPFYEPIKLLYENGFFLFSFFENNKSTNLQLLENNALFLNSNYFNEALK